MRLTARLHTAFLGALLSTVAFSAEFPPDSEPWLETPLTADPAAILRAAGVFPKSTEAGGIVLLDEARFVFDAGGRMNATYRYVSRVDTVEAAQLWSSVRQGWDPWYQSRPEIRARVITADGVSHSLDPATLSEAPEGGESSHIYDDRRALRAPLPAVREGSVVEVEYQIRESAPLFDAGVVVSYRLGNGLPTHRSIVVFDLPSELPHRHVIRGAAGIDFSRSEKNGRVLLRFSSGPLDALAGAEPYAPPDTYDRPLLALATGRSWRAVASRYAEVVDRQIAGADLQPLLGEVSTVPSPGDTDGGRRIIADNLLKRLHAEVRYTGLEFAEASIVPRTPAETLKRKYGDCKDQAALLVAMLRASGLQAHVALLRTGPGEDVESELPGIGAFDHAIVHIPGGSAAPLWIDPTDEHARAGELAPSVHGRLALVAAESTTQLVRIPPPRAEENTQRETREFYLAETGPARVVERTELSGTFERGFRSHFAGAEKSWREQLAQYVESEYLAKALGPTSLHDPRDLSRPFWLLLEAHQASRGQTERTEAATALTVGNLTQTLDPLMEALDEPKSGTPALVSEEAASGVESGIRKRTAAIHFPEPFIVERAYRIMPPPGYKLRQLPDSETETVGPATFAREFAVDDEGVVSATLRFRMEAAPIPPQEAGAFFRFVRKVRDTQPILVMFDQIGELHLASGRIREALAEFNNLVTLHPDEGLHHAQVAEALLAAGIGEAAREAARKATELDPGSASAWRARGWILQHDLVGRLRRKGFDPGGAEAAYREALRLSPDEHVTRVDLAILLEHDAEGHRYSSSARLPDAIAEYRGLMADETWPNGLDPAQMDQTFMVALARHGDFAGVEAHARTRSNSAVRHAWLLASIAAQRGPAEALRESDALAFNAEMRRAALATAGVVLMQCRRYEPAAALLVEGAKGAPNAAALINLSSVLLKTARQQLPPLLAQGPGSLLPRFLALLGSSDDATHELEGLLTKESSRDWDGTEMMAEIRRGRRQLVSALQQQGIPIEVVLDILPQVLEVSVEGDDTTGYRVQARGVTPQGQELLTLYAVLQGGEHRVLASKRNSGAVGAQALRLLDAGSTASARRWLDWARDEVPTNMTDDPYGGHPFHRLYAGGHESTPEDMRLAASSLIDAGPRLEEAIASLRRGCEAAAVDQERVDRELALAQLLFEAEDWETLAPLASVLQERHPKSATFFRLTFLGLVGLQKWEDVRRIAEQRLSLIPDDPTAIRALSELADYGKMPRTPQASLRRLIETGRASAMDYNQAAWVALAEQRVDDAALEYARRASALTNQNEYGILHTLAALFAELERTTEARELILKAMDVSGRDEPAPEDWYVLGRIAEHHGVLGAAEKAYARLVAPERPENLLMSTYTLAQRRLAAIATARATR